MRYICHIDTYIFQFMADIKATLLEFQNWLETEIAAKIETIPANDIAQERMKEAISYSLLGNAKRIRAFMIAESCKTFGFNRDEIKPLLLTIEMIHAYSLIHDDLPCMDNSDERRGKPSMHVAFDEATALLTGNALLNLAFDEILNKDFTVENYIKVQLLARISRAIGYHGMMAGQMLDIMMNGMQDIPTEQFVHMNRLKTGELFALCMSTGPILAQSVQNIEIMAKIGYDFGYIFQVSDDILDLEEDTKSPDQIDFKRNFINHIGGMEYAKKHLIFMIDQISESLERMPFDMSSIIHLARYVFKRVC